jgi:hypothetical protein
MTLARNLSNDPTENEKTSAALFAVNIRGRTNPPLPPTYLGNASFGGIAQRLSITGLKDAQTITQVAAALRSGLDAINRSSRVPLTIGLLSSRPNTQDFKFACHGFLGPDITMTSWADMGARQREWGGANSKDFASHAKPRTVWLRFSQGWRMRGWRLWLVSKSESMERMLTYPGFRQFAEE